MIQPSISPFWCAEGAEKLPEVDASLPGRDTHRARVKISKTLQECTCTAPGRLATTNPAYTSAKPVPRGLLKYVSLILESPQI